MDSCGFRIDTTYTQLSKQMFAACQPEKVLSPDLVIINEQLATDMGLCFSSLSEHELADFFTGQIQPPGGYTYAQAYAGHQFGHFTMLGDGRACVWGEHITPSGQRFDIQFKGSGPTPYSRGGDGRAALGPVLREYLISEAMHHLGVPSTRSLAVATTGCQVFRQSVLPGAVLTRVAGSLIRVGTFQFAASMQDSSLIDQLLDYAIMRHDDACKDADNKALAFLQSVMHKQINLIVNWMRVGFIHGVMNTDNMSISGETLDYGPCAFMDEYDQHTVFSAIDHQGRYAYCRQPIMAQWNLARLAQALLPLIHHDRQTAIRLAEDTIDSFSSIYEEQWLAMMRSKLGLLSTRRQDMQLIQDLLQWMQTHKMDYTNTFLDLGQQDKPVSAPYADPAFGHWYQRWQQRHREHTDDQDNSLAVMRRANPAVIPRNHQVERALASAQMGDLSIYRELLQALAKPYQQCDQIKPYQTLPQPHERVTQTFCGT